MSNVDFLKRILMITILVILLLGFWYLRSIFIIGFAALMVAVGTSVPSNWLQLQGMKRGAAIALSGSVIALIGLLLVLWIVPALIQEIVVILLQLPEMIQGGIARYEALRTSNDIISMILPDLNFENVMQLQEELGLEPESLRTFVRSLLGTGASTILTGLGLVGSLLVNLFLVAFLAAFFLIDPTTYIKASLYLVPRERRLRTMEIWNELYHTLTTWISAQFLSITITIVLVYVILGLLLRMPYALVVAVFAGVATFIPNIGLFLPIIPITIFTLADRPGWLFAYLIVYLAIQFVESNIITPLIVKSELNIPSAGLMLFQLTVATIFGPLGLLFAVPILAIIITLIRELYSYDVLELRTAPIEVMQRAGRPLWIETGTMSKKPENRWKLWKSSSSEKGA